MDHIVDDKTWLIYLLHHPNSGRMYIGKSTTGLERPRQHSEPNHLERYGHLPRARWIKSLHRKGLEPKITVLEVCEKNLDAINEAEIFFIDYYRSLFGRRNLLNLTDGGDGINGYRFSDKSKERMSVKRKARAATDEGYAEMIAMSRNYWATPEAREKKRQERLGTKMKPESVEKTAAAMRGKKKSPEHCLALKEAAKLRWQNPEYRARQVKSQKVAHGTPERKAKAAEWAKLASHDTHRSAEYRAQQSERAKASCATEEVRARKSAGATLKAQDPEYIQKLSDARKRWWAKRRGEDDPK